MQKYQSLFFANVGLLTSEARGWSQRLMQRMLAMRSFLTPPTHAPFPLPTGWEQKAFDVRYGVVVVCVSGTG